MVFDYFSKKKKKVCVCVWGGGGGGVCVCGGGGGGRFMFRDLIATKQFNIILPSSPFPTKKRCRTPYRAATRWVIMIILNTDHDPSFKPSRDNPCFYKKYLEIMLKTCLYQDLCLNPQWPSLTGTKKKLQA